MKYFNNPQTIEQLKKQYKKLAMQYHPDRGGNAEIMKLINSEYDELFKRLRGIHQTADGKTYEYRAKNDIDEFKDIINQIITLDNVNIEIIGSWLWLTGITYPHRELLKKLKFRFSRSKQAWYYHDEYYKKTRKKCFSLDEIRDLYGSETISRKPQLKLKIV